MANMTPKSLDKTKLLDQMLEDLAGDEFDDFDVTEKGIGRNASRFDADEDFLDIDNLH